DARSKRNILAMSPKRSGDSPQRASITRYCGWVSPSGSRMGRYTPITLRLATANAKHTCWSSSSSSSESSSMRPYYLVSAQTNCVMVSFVRERKRRLWHETRWDGLPGFGNAVRRLLYQFEGAAQLGDPNEPAYVPPANPRCPVCTQLMADH